MASLQTTQGYVDSASTYELVAAFDVDSPEEAYPWAWEISLVLTNALIQADHLTIAPSPSAAGAASGLYGVLMSALDQTDIVSAGSRPPAILLKRATRTAGQWALDNSQVILGEFDRLKADTRNFAPWLQRSVRDAWPEHASRLNGLFNVEFVPQIALVLNLPPKFIEEVRLLSTDPGLVARYAATEPEGEEAFIVMRDAYVVSSILRGKLHDFVRRTTRTALLRHPFRNPGGYQQPSGFTAFSETEWWFANIIVANAFNSSKDPRQRIHEWVKGVKEARSDRKRGKLFLPRIQNREDAQEAAVAAAMKMELRIPPKWLSKAADVAIALGVGALTFHLGEVTAFTSASATGAVTIFGEPSRRAVDKLRERSLEKLIHAGPKSIDVCNFVKPTE